MSRFFIAPIIPTCLTITRSNKGAVEKNLDSTVNIFFIIFNNITDLFLALTELQYIYEVHTVLIKKRLWEKQLIYVKREKPYLGY